MSYTILKPCPACGQEPAIEQERNAAQVVCHCGLRGPTVIGKTCRRDDDKDDEPRYPLVSAETSAFQDAEEAWNELPAHGLASGEESAWLAVVVALRDKFHQQKRIDGGRLDDANRIIEKLAEELRFWKERYRAAGETESWFVTQYEIWKLGGPKPKGL